jgi:hypothetical protein
MVVPRFYFNYLVRKLTWKKLSKKIAMYVCCAETLKAYILCFYFIHFTFSFRSDYCFLNLILDLWICQILFLEFEKVKFAMISQIMILSDLWRVTPLSLHTLESKFSDPQKFLWPQDSTGHCWKFPSAASQLHPPPFLTTQNVTQKITDITKLSFLMQNNFVLSYLFYVKFNTFSHLQ